MLGLFVMMKRLELCQALKVKTHGHLRKHNLTENTTSFHIKVQNDVFQTFYFIPRGFNTVYHLLSILDKSKRLVLGAGSNQAQCLSPSAVLSGF